MKGEKRDAIDKVVGAAAGTAQAIAVLPLVRVTQSTFF